MGQRSLTFGLRIPPCTDVRQVAGCAGAAERAGFGVAWFPDSQFIWRDVWATMALAAQATERIALGTCVVNFETRHATVTAAAAATIEELAPARTILGIGTGDSAVKTLAIAPTTLARMREHIGVVRALLAGDEQSFENRHMSLSGMPRRAVPIYMAATGPKALALAGELADGVILLAGMAPELIQKAVFHIGEGAKRAGRDAGAIDVCLGTFCHITSDKTVAARIVKPYCVTSAQLGGSEALRLVGIDVEVPAVVEGVYPDMAHAVDWDAAVEAAGRWITDDMGLRYAEKFCLVGDPRFCIEKIEAAVACGVTSFYIRHFSSYTLPHEVLGAFASAVIPHFNHARAATA